MQTEDKIAFSIVGIVIAVVIFGLMYLFKVVGGWFFDISSLGWGFREALPLGVIISLVVMLLFALFGGDGLIFGEIPFMIAGFFIFTLFFTVSIAWLY